jgi:plasmid maintenance system antidote protein VapI
MYVAWMQAKLNNIVRKKRVVTPIADLALADALGTSPELWFPCSGTMISGIHQ